MFTGDGKKTTINLPERPKRALLADDGIDSSLLTVGVKRSAGDARSVMALNKQCRC